MPKPNEKGLSNKLTEAWQLRDMYVKLNDVELCDIDVIDYECVYGGCQVPAQLKFIDSKGYTTGDSPEAANLTIGGFVEVGFTTADGCDHKELFSIKDIIMNTNKHNQKMVTLKLEDAETRNMKGAFKVKGYPGKKFSEAVQSHMKEIGNDALRAGKELVVAAPKMIQEKALNLVVPGHLNFHEFLNIELKERGFHYIKDRAMNYLVHEEHKEFGKLLHTGNVFEFDAVNEFDFNRIVQFDIAGYSSEVFHCALSTSNTSLDPIDANSDEAVKGTQGTDSKISKKNAEKSQNDMDVSGVKMSEMANIGRGSKQGSQIGGNQQYFNNLSNANKASIWVPGRVDNLIGKMIKAIFPKPTYYATQNDHLFTGDWEVYLVRDKIINGFFMNELFLRRPGGKEQK